MKISKQDNQREQRLVKATLPNGDRIDTVVHKAFRYNDPNTDQGMFAEWAIFYSGSHALIGTINVVLFGVEENQENAEYVVEKIGSILWGIRYPHNHNNKASKDDAIQEFFSPQQPLNEVTPAKPIILNSTITQNFNKPIVIGLSGSISLSLLKLSNLEASNRGIVIQLGLFEDSQLIGLLQVYVLKHSDQNAALNAAVAGAKELWRNWLS